MPTLASDTIKRAYRKSNLIPLVATPSTAQTDEALPLLNEEILGALGNEAGTELHDINIGGAYDQSQFLSSWIPENTRLILNLGSGRTFNLHPEPYEGQRLGVVDAANNLSTANLVLSGNGRLIEGATSLTLSTNGDARQWLYRADTANWTKITALASGDAMPLPQEFDSFFVIRLAIALNPQYGQSIAPEVMNQLSEVEGRIRARYRRPRRSQDLGTLGLMGQRRTGFGPTFNEGWLYR